MSKTYLKEAVPAAQVAKDLAGVKETVTGVIADIRERGDEAVREYSAKFDNWSPGDVPALGRAGRGHRRRPARPGDRGHHVRPGAGARVRRGRSWPPCGRSRSRPCPASSSATGTCPIASAGAYIPGGRYPLTASAHMTVLTAKVAGVGRVVACTPPIRGEIPAATVAAAHLAGADEISCSAASRRSPRWPSAPRRSARST